MVDINGVGQQLNWDYIMPSEIGKATLVGISNLLPNSPANATKRFNQQQFSPINYLPHTANNSMQDQYGIDKFEDGGTTGDVPEEIDMDKEMEHYIMDSPKKTEVTPTPPEENPIHGFIDDLTYADVDQAIYSSLDFSKHFRPHYDSDGKMMNVPKTKGVQLQGVEPDVMQAGQELLSKFPGLQITSGVRNWGDKDAHPVGRALDFGGDKQTLQEASKYYEENIVPKYKFNKPLALVHSSVKDGKPYVGAPHIHLGYY